mgnify:FL=1
MGLEDRGSGKDEAGDPKADGGGRVKKASKPSGSDVPGGSVDSASGVNLVGGKSKKFCT